jgi:hypothetical protein
LKIISYQRKNELRVAVQIKIAKTSGGSPVSRPYIRADSNSVTAHTQANVAFRRIFRERLSARSIRARLIRVRAARAERRKRAKTTRRSVNRTRIKSGFCGSSAPPSTYRSACRRKIARLPSKESAPNNAGREIEKIRYFGKLVVEF